MFEVLGNLVLIAFVIITALLYISFGLYALVYMINKIKEESGR